MMETNGKFAMNCEQAEIIVLDLDRKGAVNSAEAAAALEHLNHCSRCAALQESWETAKEELRAWSGETLEAHAPARVEMRLMQEFRMRHHRASARRVGIVAAWALASAAVIAAGLSWWNVQNARNLRNTKQNLSVANGSGTGVSTAAQPQTPSDLVAGLTNGDDASDFTPLPGFVPGDTEEAAILRVRMQRGSLGALGLPVNEQRAGEWIQVDLLVGNDGLPEAVRLAQEEN